MSAAQEQAAAAQPSDLALRLAEALLFAAGKPVTHAGLQEVLPEGEQASAVLAALAARYAGRGVELVEVAGGVAFRTAPDLAPLLTKVVETPRRLSRAAMEALAVIAWHQPVTRPEIEEIRGAALAQATLESLLEAGLVAPRGRKEVPGRPTLWGTTAKFLEQFGLRSLNDLPKREELLAERPAPLAPPAGDDDGAGDGAPAVAAAAEAGGAAGDGSASERAPADVSGTPAGGASVGAGLTPGAAGAAPTDGAAEDGPAVMPHRPEPTA